MALFAQCRLHGSGYPLPVTLHQKVHTWRFWVPTPGDCAPESAHSTVLDTQSSVLCTGTDKVLVYRHPSLEAKVRKAPLLQTLASAIVLTSCLHNSACANLSGAGTRSGHLCATSPSTGLWVPSGKPPTWCFAMTPQSGICCLRKPVGSGYPQQPSLRTAPVKEAEWIHPGSVGSIPAAWGSFR